MYCDNPHHVLSQQTESSGPGQAYRSAVGRTVSATSASHTTRIENEKKRDEISKAEEAAINLGT